MTGFGSTQRRALGAHDLRHALALLACDLRLSRGRLDANAPWRSALLALLARLEAGLGNLDSLAAGHGARAWPGADKAPLVAALWERQLRARVPGDGRPDRDPIPGDGGPAAPTSSRTAESAIAIDARLELERPLPWPGDPLLWHVLIANLLGNAWEAAPAGPVLLRATGQELLLRNGGRSLPAALAESLRRGEAPAPGERRGHGLGLIVSAARELGLRLELDLAAGLSEFRFSRGPAEAPTLLLIEDDADLRCMLAEFLRGEGYRVDLQDGEGLARPRRGRYAAVIADLNLPGASGDRRLAAWRRADPGLRTILLTGASEAASRDWPGVDQVIVKPGLTRLVAALAGAGERRR